MKRKRRIKIIWGGAEAIKGHWHLGLWGFYQRVEGEHDDGLAISVRGGLRWLLALGVVAYCSGAVAVFSFWARNPYNLLTYSDALLLPVRRAAIAEKQGQALNAQGMDLWRAKKYHEAASALRLGLERFPRDFPARLTLAHYYVLTNQHARALATLQAGLGGSYPGRAYVRTMFGLAQQGENHELIARAAEKLRGGSGAELTPAEQRWLDDQRFMALLHGGKSTEALAFAEREPAGDESAEHRVLALLDLKRTGDAVAFLAEWRTRPKAEVKVVSRLEVRAFREAGRFDEMEGAIKALRDCDPTDPESFVYGVVQRALAGRDEAARAALEDYLFRFGSTPARIQLVAGPLEGTGQVGLLERCLAAAKERGYATRVLQKELVQCHLRRGESEAAAELLNQLPPLVGREAESEQVWLMMIRSLIDAAGPAPAAAAGTSGPADVLRGRFFPIPAYRFAIEVLRRAGGTEAARNVARLGVDNFPASVWLGAQLAELGPMPEVPVANPPVAPAASRVLAEGEFFARLEVLVREKKWSEAKQQIVEARRIEPSPGWLQRREGELRLFQVRLAHSSDELAEMLGATRLYLNGDATRAGRLMELAREFANEGDTKSALLLAQEVKRRLPGFAPADRALAEWQAKPGTGK